MKEINIPYFNEQRLVLRAMVLSAKHSSESVDKFVQWMVAGSGAGLVYLVSKTDVSTAVDTTRVDPQSLVLIFIFATLSAALQRMCALIINVSATTFQESEKLPPDGQVIDLPRFFILYIDALPASYRWAGAFAAKQFLSGNLTQNGKWLMRLSILQSAFASLTVIILLFGLWLYLPL